jgi:hypothetical protein
MWGMYSCPKQGSRYQQKAPTRATFLLVGHDKCPCDQLFLGVLRMRLGGQRLILQRDNRVAAYFTTVDASARSWEARFERLVKKSVVAPVQVLWVLIRNHGGSDGQGAAVQPDSQGVQFSLQVQALSKDGAELAEILKSGGGSASHHATEE